LAFEEAGQITMISDPQRFKAAIERIDVANSEDPNTEVFGGQEYPKELLYSQRMSAWLARLEPNASEALCLAARSQHICRWVIPRDAYPMDRIGYLQWRKDLGKFHAEKAGQILREVGYDEETITRVKSLLRKEKLKSDLEMQLLEDVICLVFLENYLADFAQEHDEGKLIGIIHKTWKKMSPRGHVIALQLEMPANARALVEKALQMDSNQ
jgi:hypothetical protein